jgi:uncharacterized RDD family membrane protein YckC
VVCPNCGTLNVNEADSCRRCNTRLHPPTMKGKIACVVHANREATTSCGVCGNRLCGQCAINVNGIDYCDTCAPADALRMDYDDSVRLPVLDVTKTPQATLWMRFAAMFTDIGMFILGTALIAGISFMFAGRADYVISPKSGPGFWLFWIFVLFLGTAYSAVMTAAGGQTMGKRLLGVIILTPEGNILDWRSSVLRALTAIVSAAPLFLGFLWAIWDPEHRTWHDKVAQSVAYQWEEVA